MGFVDANGKRLEYFERGDGADTVVLIHGAGSSALIWDTVARLLEAEGFHTVAISLPGAGGSDRPAGLSHYSPASYAKDIRAALEALDVRSFALVGHSLGVWNVLNFACDQADGFNLRALVLMAGGNVIERAAATPEKAEERLNAYQPPDPATAPERREVWERFHQGLEPDIRERLWHDIQNNPPEREVGQGVCALKDMTAFAEQCEIPTLIISGDADSVVPLRHTLAMYPKFKREIRHCHVMHGVDHYPNAEVPDEIARVYSRFFRNHQLPTRTGFG